MENQKIMKNIELLGERYCKEHLDSLDKEKLENNWWKGLKFFFDRSFMRGRRDELSEMYCIFAIATLEDRFRIGQEYLQKSYKKLQDDKEHFDIECILNFKRLKKIGRGNSVKHKDFAKEVAEKNPIVKLLTTCKDAKGRKLNEGHNKKACLGNDADIMMVLDVLKFISNEKQKNIYHYLKAKIDRDGAKATYDELKGLRGIGDKLASLLIRDISLINPKIVKNDYNYYEKAFPVDTWVRKIAETLDCHNKNKKDKDIKDYFIQKCKDSNVEQLKVAAGLWYMGSHCLDILINDYLCVVPLKKRS